MPAALNILIADDDDGDRKHIRRALHSSGLPHACTEAASMEEALRACERTAFDCAILDYQLPGQDGLSGISAIRKRHPFMAIIMSTGQGDEMVAAEAIQRGATEYIPKQHITAASLRRISENAVEKAALKRRLAEQQEELQRFAHVLVHDLKAPLGLLIKFGQCLEMDAGAGDLEETLGYCRQMAQAARRMHTLIDTLHQYTQSAAEAPFRLVELDEALGNALANLSHVIAEHGARVTREALPAVLGNAAQLTQMFQNLIANGIKYCRAPVPCIHISANGPEGGMWRIAVRDNGIGIAEEHYRAVFEPFTRLHGEKEFEGTGLGLATCKKIAERHGGGIACESRPDEGTTFTFTLSDIYSAGQGRV